MTNILQFILRLLLINGQFCLETLLWATDLNTIRNGFWTIVTIVTENFFAVRWHERKPLYHTNPSDGIVLSYHPMRMLGDELFGMACRLGYQAARAAWYVSTLVQVLLPLEFVVTLWFLICRRLPGLGVHLMTQRIIYFYWYVFATISTFVRVWRVFLGILPLWKIFLGREADMPIQ